MILTREEIGDEQYVKGQNDRGRFRGARAYASERGHIAATHLESLKLAIDSPLYTETARLRFSSDAELFARMAFKGWRAYRLMKGE